ncbi:hypothetical protein QE377_002763 [Microbacterium sp. SORGH_AS 862]|nr:hypothetical protein [Microbacterium sp. SORGH_AS_0862]
MPHPSPKFASSLPVPPGSMEKMRPAGASPDRKDSPVDAQLASDLLLGFIGLLSLGSLIGVVGAFWSMGRQNYRKS